MQPTTQFLPFRIALHIIHYLSKMRFIQYMEKCSMHLGVLSADGKLVTALPAHVGTFKDLCISLTKNLSLRDVENMVKQGKSVPLTDDHTILPPIYPGKIICVALNYQDHCSEQSKPAPTEPVFFSKFNTCLVGHKGCVTAHKATQKIDWEVELAVVIGKEAKFVKVKDAMNYVFGYTIAQDITARDWVKERNGGQYLIGKSMDTFCPLGPHILHKSLIDDVNNLNMKTIINGIEKQNGNTKHMIFKIDDIISRLSETITLLPGDIILTGTPAGVGVHRDPPEFLKPGDIINSVIENIGTLTNTVIEPFH